MHGKTQTAVLDLLMITNVNSKNAPGLEKILETFSFHGVFNCFHQLLKAQACLLGVGLWALNVFKRQLNLVVTVFVCFKSGFVVAFKLFNSARLLCHQLWVMMEGYLKGLILKGNNRSHPGVLV